MSERRVFEPGPLEISATSSFGTPRSHFLERIQRISHAIKEKVPIRSIDPEIFTKYSKIDLGKIEGSFQEMMRFALEKFIPAEDRQRIRSAIESSRQKGSFRPFATAARAIQRKGVHPYMLAFMGHSVSRYLSTMSSLDFIRQELVQKKRNARQLGRFLTRNWEAGHHLSGLQSDFDLAERFQTLKDELAVHELLLPQMNAIEIQGLRHHFAIGNKQSCLSYFASVFGGDNFNIAQFPGGKVGKRKFLITSVDHESHGFDYITTADHTRHYNMGSDDALIRMTPGGHVETDAQKKKFLQDYMFNLHTYLKDRGKKADALAMVYDEADRSIHYAVAGMDHPTVYHPEKGILEKPKLQGEVLGLDRKKLSMGMLDDLTPDEIEVHRLDWEPGMALTTGSDGTREIDPAFGKKKFRYKSQFGTYEAFKRYVREDSAKMDIGHELDHVFFEAVKAGKTPEEINDLLFSYAYKRRGVPFLADDSREITLVAA